MRFRVLVGTLLVLGLFAGTAQAAQTVSYSGTIGSSKPFAVDFTTGRDGVVSVTATFDARKGQVYWLDVFHCRAGAVSPCAFAYDQSDLDQYVASGSGTVARSVSVDEGLSGLWRVEITQKSGRTPVTLTVTAETD